MPQIKNKSNPATKSPPPFFVSRWIGDFAEETSESCFSSPNRGAWIVDWHWEQVNSWPAWVGVTSFEWLHSGHGSEYLVDMEYFRKKKYLFEEWHTLCGQSFYVVFTSIVCFDSLMQRQFWESRRFSRSVQNSGESSIRWSEKLGHCDPAATILVRGYRFGNARVLNTTFECRRCIWETNGVQSDSKVQLDNLDNSKFTPEGFNFTGRSIKRGYNVMTAKSTLSLYQQPIGLPSHLTNIAIEALVRWAATQSSEETVDLHSPVCMKANCQPHSRDDCGPTGLLSDHFHQSLSVHLQEDP